MAKLTATFDMRDKMSKKLRAMQGNLEGFERHRKKMEKPMVLKVKDEATKNLKRIHGFVRKDLAKTHTLVVSLSDKFTKPAKAINRYLERKLPKTHTVIVKAQDRAKSVLEKINRYMGRHLTGAKMFAVIAKDKAMPTMHKIANYGKRMLSKGYNFSVRAIDIASKTVGRIASFTKSAIPKYRDFTVRAIDSASRMIGSVKNALFSIPSVITVTLAAVGIGSLGKSTIGAAMDFEGYEVGMKHWLGGNEKQADELVSWMGRFADSTPFSSADLFPALSRGIGVSGGNVKEAQKLLGVAADMASIMPGKTVSDAMEALADARLGEFARMTEFGMKFSKEDFDNIGWSGFMSQVTNTFDGAAEEFSKTARGQLMTIQGYTSTLFREAGSGILESMKPRLTAIRQWIDENQDKWGEWKNTVQQAGEQGAEWVFSKLEGAFSYIRDNYLENDEFKNLDFEGKVKFIMDDLGEWWDTTGRPWLSDVSKDIGTAVFDGIVWGVKEGVKGIGSMWVDAFKDPSVGNFAGAGIATAIAGSIASLVLSPLINGFGVLYKTGKWFWDRAKDTAGLFNKGKTPKTPPVPVNGNKKPTKTPSNAKTTFFSGMFGGKGKGKKPTYTNPWFNKGSRPDLNTPNQFKGKGKFSFSNIGKDLGKFGKGLGTVVKKVPVLGTILGIGSILAAPKGQKGEAIGSVGGGLGGAAAGAAIGSIVPGIGTAIGGIVGGIAGSLGGGKLGGWLGDNWETIKTKASEAASSIGNAFNTAKEGIASTLFNGEWWGEKWESVKQFASTFFSADYWLEKAGFVYGYLEETIFNGEWWASKWEAVKTMTEGTMFDSEWWYAKWEAVKTWTSEKWDSAVAIWQSIKTKFAETVFSSDWWLGKWESVKGWAQTKWDSAVTVWNSVKTKIGETIFSGEWWQGKWEDVKGWTSEKWESATSIWEDVKSGISESLFNADWWQGKWESVMGWAQDVLGGLGSWVGGIVQDVKDSFGAGREKGNKAASKETRYANGGLITRPHLGLVGEAGPEMIIPLSANRRSRAMNLYEQTGKALGVRQYANGGFVGGATLPEEQVSTVIVSNPSKGSTGRKRGDINIDINGEYHFHNDMDINQFGEEIVAIIQKALEDEYVEGGEMVVYG